MPHICGSSKRFLRKITGRRQKQPDIPPAAPSATGSTHVQQEQSRDSCPSASPANLQQPPAAESLWDQAYNALAKKTPDLVKDYDELLAKEEQMANSAPNETTASQLPAPHGLDTRSDRSSRQIQLDTVIQKALLRMEDKADLKIPGHEIDLTGQITSNLLLWGKEWIGNTVKVSPEASLVWSAVCLVLPLLTNPTTAAEAQRDGFAYVTSCMGYYVALEPLVRRLGQNARVDEAMITAVNGHIVDLYQAILDFQLRSVLRFYHSRPKTYAHDIVSLKDWKETLLDIKTREETVNGDLGQINDLAARQELERHNKTSEETHAALENILTLLIEQQQKRLRAEQQKCLQAFFLRRNANDATYDWYKDRVELRVKGTCDWFLQHEIFQEWLLQESGPLLVSADPGCGKSVLARYLIDHGLAQQSATICYFFFKDQDQNTICQALCAILHRLFSQKGALLQHAMELYNKMGEKLVQSESLLWSILRNAVGDPQAGPVIFVIDALDECAESELSSLKTNLEDMFRDQQLAKAKFKVLMTSRPYQHVVGELYSSRDDFRHIHIPLEDDFEVISQEINTVIHYRVKQLAKKHRLSDKIKSSLSSNLLAIDHRTYLWVYIVFDCLDKEFSKGLKKTEGAIDAAIQTLPKTVNEAYDQILNRSQDDESVKTAKKALSIILAARQPLTLAEMNIAMNPNDQGQGWSIEDLDSKQNIDFKTRLRTLCGLFVNIHHDKVYFLHQTAREFLMQSSASTTVSSEL